jgi:aminomethyltransferase
VDLNVDFIGAEAMRKVKGRGPRRKLVGLELDGKRIARQGHTIVNNGEDAGRITSGTMSPTLQKSIAMGYVDAALAEPGTELAVDLGRKQNPAKVVPLPFYKRPKKK